MHEQRERFPVIYSFDGRLSEDGTMLLVEGMAFDDSLTRFAVPVDNVMHFVAFLLMWAGTLPAKQACADESTLMCGGAGLPIPVSSISIGEPSGNEGYIAISVGRAELIFTLPLSAFTPIAQSLMLAGAQPNSTLS